MGQNNDAELSRAYVKSRKADRSHRCGTNPTETLFSEFCIQLRSLSKASPRQFKAATHGGKGSAMAQMPTRPPTSIHAVKEA